MHIVMDLESNTVSAELHTGPNFVTRPDPEKPERDPTLSANFKKFFRLDPTRRPI